MKEIKNNFELDYWALSYREAMEYIAKKDESNQIKVYFDTVPGWYNLQILNKKDRNRIKIVEDKYDAKYLAYSIRTCQTHP